MSSPLNSLDKNKKSPSNRAKYFGKRVIPFRNDDFAEERDLLENIEKNNKLPQLNANSRSPTASAPNDIELLSVMMKRVTQLEKQVVLYTKEIVEKDQKIKILEDKVSIISKANKIKGKFKDTGEVEHLETKCFQLQQQIDEMETFLADYGMIWVGDRANPTNGENSSSERKSPNFQLRHNSANTSDFKIDYDLILKNVNELNLLAGDGESKIEKTKDGARLKPLDPVPLTLYANGIFMFNGPFRPIDDITTRRCLADLMDGFFPVELQKLYPEGVPLKVVDKRDTIFKDPRLAFPGVGRLLQSSSGGRETSNNLMDESALSSFKHSGKNYEVSSELPGPRLTANQFLNKLPGSVIHDGKVIGIKSSVKEHLTNPGTSKTLATTEVVETKVMTEDIKRMNMPADIRPKTAQDITTIRVKSEDGSKSYVLKMKFSDTIDDLRRYIDQQRPTYHGFYDIVSTFPKKTHSDLSKTLRESGLTPNATLHLKRS